MQRWRTSRTACGVTPGVAVPRFGWRRQWIPAHVRRRLLAALLAGAAAALALSARHHTNPSATAPAAIDRPVADPLTARLGVDQVAAPVRLVDPQVGGLLHTGAFVDVLAAPGSPTGPADDTQSPARVIASAVRVLAVPAGSSAGTSSTAGSLVVLAVSRNQAQALAGAEAAGRLSVVLVAP